VGKLSILPRRTGPHSKKYMEVEDAWDMLVTKMVKQDDWCEFSETEN
jgi:hypothetical protein